MTLFSEQDFIMLLILTEREALRFFFFFDFFRRSLDELSDVDDR